MAERGRRRDSAPVRLVLPRRQAQPSAPGAAVASSDLMGELRQAMLDAVLDDFQLASRLQFAKDQVTDRYAWPTAPESAGAPPRALPVRSSAPWMVRRGVRLRSWLREDNHALGAQFADGAFRSRTTPK